MNIVIYLSAFGFAVMGIVALLKPQLVTRLFGVHSIGTDMANEVRAVYGGFGCAVAILLLISSQNQTLKVGILITVAVSLLGMASGRVISFAISRQLSFYPLLFLGIELVLGCSLLWVGFYCGAS